MQRITQKMLEARCEYLNKLTNNPATYRDDSGVINVGHYYISGAYGGVNLVQVVNNSGGCRDVISYGHIPKRELYGLINAYIAGIEGR